MMDDEILAAPRSDRPSDTKPSMETAALPVMETATLPIQEAATRTVQDAAAVSGQSPYGFWGVVSSLIALLFSGIAVLLSGITLYETVLKRAQPAIYESGIIRYWRDQEDREVFALPMTIANHGMQDAVVTGLSLSAQKLGQPTQARFTSAYFGDGPEAALKLFTPISIAGHNSFGGTVIFYRDTLNVGAAQPPLIDARDVYVFCVSIQTELSEEWSMFRFQPLTVGFQAELPWFDRSALASGQPVSMRIDKKEHLSSCPNQTPVLARGNAN